ncbi:MAG: hypothetical protein JO304_05105 [Solirubrobacterales bacterium]|nr:hypothetical protein [Solirubrobacterales bacterium]
MSARDMRMWTATAIAVVLMGSLATPGVSGVSASTRLIWPSHTSTGSATARSSRPVRADWEKIKVAARLRTMALAPHRTARFRAFAAELGLRELVSLHPLGHGRCATAVIYLYNNLLDLDDAYPGENWTPLRRAVAREPSIDVCAPRPSKRTMATARAPRILGV